jgi:hypothetical protein
MMTNEQSNKIQAILVERGMTFKPLQDEMIDHIGCDVEKLMDAGASFDDALHQTMGEIPADHFATIQRDTLLVIDKRFVASQWLSYLTIGSLFLALLFKILHLQFSGELLILSFILMAIALLTGSFSGVSVTREKKGIGRVMAMVAGVIILQLGYAFKILHLPGAESIILAAIAVTVGALLTNTYKVYQHAPGKETMLTFLHEKYTPNIERFLLVLLFAMTAVKIITITTSFQVSAGPIILLIIILGGGLQFIALTWRILEQQVIFKKPVFFVGIAIASLCLALPFLGEILRFEIRVVSVTAFALISAWLAFRMQQHSTNAVSFVMAILVPIVFIVWATVKLQLLPGEFNRYVFNLPVLALLVAGLVVSKKHDTMRSYMTVSISGYLIEYTL